MRDGALERSLYERDASDLRGDAAVVCFPLDTAEVQACVRAARRHGRPFVARGAGTGLAGGAAPVGDPVVIVTTKMDRVAVDRRRPRASRGSSPGVVNLDLNRQLAPLGLHFAPDPSSQQACTVGGNVANNSGGPHCLASGVTSAHVLALEVVLPDGEVAMLGGLDPEPAGYDLRGAFVGSEGTLGIATRIAVRLTPLPPAVATLLLGFPSVRDAAAAVSAVIAAGLVPAALEMMDQRITRAVEDFVHAGLPDRRRGRAAGRGRRPAGRGRRGPRPDRGDRPRPRRHARCGSRRTRPSGPGGGRAASRRSARSPASSRTTTCTTRSCPAGAWSRCSPRSTPSSSATTSS